MPPEKVCFSVCIYDALSYGSGSIEWHIHCSSSLEYLEPSHFPSALPKLDEMLATVGPSAGAHLNECSLPVFTEREREENNVMEARASYETLVSMITSCL